MILHSSTKPRHSFENDYFVSREIIKFGKDDRSYNSNVAIVKCI